LNLLLDKFNNILNLKELLAVIAKEVSIVKSDKKSHIRKCMFTGQLLLMKTLLGLKQLPLDVLQDILKVLSDLLRQNVVEEGVLFTIDSFLSLLNEGYYTEFSVKKVTDKFLKFVDALIVNKNSPKNVIEYSLIFILTKCSLQDTPLAQAIKNYLPNSTVENLLEEQTLFSYLKTILTNKPRENEFHISFGLFLELLKQIGNFKKISNIWNCLIDPEMQKEMKTTSLKNYQFMVYLVSKFILDNYFELNYVRQIFDHTYFESLLKFTSKNKFKYISTLLEIIQQKMKENDNKNLVSEYSYDLLNVFGNDPNTGISPQSYKGLFLYLFSNLQNSQKSDFVDSIVADGDDDDIEEVQYKTTIIRILITAKDTDEDLKSRLLNFQLTKFINTQNEGVELESLLTERTLASILLVTNDQKDSKMIKNLVGIHKAIQKLFKEGALEIEKEDYDVRMIN
jgi:hypothetical protein